MITYEYKFRVVYSDTDRMGTVHHSNYARYYERARWELLRNIGAPYKTIEDAGIMCPVISMKFKFVKTTKYDELLTVKTTLKAIKGVRIWFSYQLHNEKDELINEAETELAFVGLNNWKPCVPPSFLLQAIERNQNDSTTK